MLNLVEQFVAVLSSRRFTQFFDGVDFVLPDGKKSHFKIENYSKPIRIEGYRFAKFSFVTKILTDQGMEGFGFGEGEDQLLSFQKSIAEAVERAVYTSLKPYLGLTTSNGWAAHLTQAKAEKSALNELLERDAILAHWLTEKPFIEIDPITFPEWLTSWRDQELSRAPEFKHLRILVSAVGHVPVVQTVISNSDGYAYLSHGTSRSLDTAIYRALAETCRIVSGAIRDPESSQDAMLDSPSTPWGHALFYAKNQKLPQWVFGGRISFGEAKRSFEQNGSFDPLAIQPRFKSFRCGDLMIVRCESEKIQNLYWGRGDEALEKGLINLSRLREVDAAFKLNPLPHCVP